MLCVYEVFQITSVFVFFFLFYNMLFYSKGNEHFTAFCPVFVLCNLTEFNGIFRKQSLVFFTAFQHHICYQKHIFLTNVCLQSAASCFTFCWHLFFPFVQGPNMLSSLLFVYLKPEEDSWLSFGFWQNYRTLLSALCISFSCWKQKEKVVFQRFVRATSIPKPLQCTSAYV